MGSKNSKFGPRYAVINLSRIGMRYFRLFIRATPATRKRLTASFVNHPNVGWIFSAKGWFNLGIGLWAKDNAEIIDVSSAIRALLTPKDEIVYQSELTTLYSFGGRPLTHEGVAMRMVDATTQPVELDYLSIDYLKLLAIDSSFSNKEFSEILGVNENAVERLNHDLKANGVVVGYQDRINYAGKYLKVVVDTASRKVDRAVENLIDRLWRDEHCIYFERANGKYDLEFEVILGNQLDLRKYLKEFSVFRVAEFTKNLYTNLLPLNKTANFKEIRDALSGQGGKVIDLRNSKLWYLNYEGAKAYISIYENKKYMELMEKSELDLLDGVVAFIKGKFPRGKLDVIDIGSGDGLKGRIVIEKIGEDRIKSYYPVDIQPVELAAVMRAHQDGAYPKHPTLLNIESLSARFPLETPPDEKQVYVFLGGTYGNFPIPAINSYLKPIVDRSDSLMVVTMPVRSGKAKENEIIESYSSQNIENFIFSPLLHLGFQKQDFKRNRKHPDLVTSWSLEDNRLTSTLVLRKDVALLGRKFAKGTAFKMTSSWKPTVGEFEEALSRDFKVERMSSNKDIAMAIVSRRKSGPAFRRRI